MVRALYDGIHVGWGAALGIVLSDYFGRGEIPSRIMVAELVALSFLWVTSGIWARVEKA